MGNVQLNLQHQNDCDVPEHPERQRPAFNLQSSLVLSNSWGASHSGFTHKQSKFDQQTECDAAAQKTSYFTSHSQTRNGILHKESKAYFERITNAVNLNDAQIMLFVRSAPFDFQNEIWRTAFLCVFACVCKWDAALQYIIVCLIELQLFVASSPHYCTCVCKLSLVLLLSSKTSLWSIRTTRWAGICIMVCVWAFDNIVL